MTQEAAVHISSNPFSTRFVRPGAIAYRFAPGDDPDSVIGRLAANGWRGQIIGPHGSGKSTLLASLLEPLERAGRRPWLVTLVDRQRRLPADWLEQAEAAAATLLVIDGYEQLGWWSRWRASAICRRRGWGLLVTAHAAVGFPTLVRTVGDLQVATAIVDTLLEDSRLNDSLIDNAIAPFDRALVAQAFGATDGNVREMLFRLYDAFEAERRSGV